MIDPHEDHGKYVAMQEVVGRVLALTVARHHAEMHPEDPHGADSVDMCEEYLEVALDAWADLR